MAASKKARTAAPASSEAQPSSLRILRARKATSIAQEPLCDGTDEEHSQQIREKEVGEPKTKRSSSTKPPSASSKQTPAQGKRVSSRKGPDELSATRSEPTLNRESGMSASKSRRSSLGDPPMEFGDALAAKTLLDCIQLRDKEDQMRLSLSLDAWIDRYIANNDAGIVELINFFVAAAGLSSSELDLASVEEDVEDPLEELLTPEALQALIDGAMKAGTFVEPYPLADKKSAKKFKAGLYGVIRGILEKIKHEIIFDRLLMPWCIEWLSAMTHSTHRGVRHTGTEAALAIMTITNELHVEKLAELTQRKRLLTGSKKKKDPTQESLSDEIEKLEEHTHLLLEMHGSIFEAVCVLRYRDTHDDIRLCCIQALGKCVVTQPEEYLKDTSLKYIGWMLNDQQSASVRAGAVQQLQFIYKGLTLEQLGKVSGFTERFEPRFVELAMDTSTAVACEALKLLSVLFDRQLISDYDSAMKQVLPLMHVKEVSLWRALAPLLQRYVSRVEDETGTNSNAKVGRLARSDSGLSGHLKSPLFRLAMLVSGLSASDYRSAYCERLVGAMRSIEPLLSDWSAYVELLLADATLDDDQHVEAQSVLLHMMAASAACLHASVDDAQIEEDGTSKSKKRKDNVAQDEEVVSLAAQLGKNLPQLINKYGVHAEHLRTVLKLVGQLRLDAAQATLKVARLNELLGSLESVCFKHTERGALEACALAWRQILDQEGAPALHEAAQVRYTRLCAKLQQAIKPVATPIIKGKTPNASASHLGELDVAMLRLSCIAAVGAQPIVGVRGIAPALVGLLEENANRNLKVISSCLMSTFQLQLTQLLFSANSTASSDTQEDGHATKDLCKHWNELLPPLIRASRLQEPRALALQAFYMLGVALIAIKPFESDLPQDLESVKLAEEARTTYLSQLQWMLEALSEGQGIGEDEKDAHDDEDEESACAEEDDDDPKATRMKGSGRYPQWMMEVARVAYLGAVPRAYVVGALALSADAVGGRLPLLLEDLWGQLSKVLDVAQLATDVLVYMCEPRGMPVGVTAGATTLGLAGGRLSALLSAGDRRRADANSYTFVLRVLRWALEQTSDTPCEPSLLDAGLCPSLKYLSQESASKLVTELKRLATHKQLELPRFASSLARIASGEKLDVEKANRAPASQQANGARPATGRKRGRTVAAAKSKKVARAQTAGSRRSSRMSVTSVAHKESDNDDSDMEGVVEAVEESLPPRKARVQPPPAEEDEDELPWDGGGVDLPVEEEPTCDGDEDEGEEEDEGEDEEDEGEDEDDEGEDDEGEDESEGLFLGNEEDEAPGSRANAAPASIYDRPLEDSDSVDDEDGEAGVDGSQDELPVYSYARRPRKRAL